MTLHSAHFLRSSELSNFVNTQGILQANILKIDVDASNGGWVIWWWA